LRCPTPQSGRRRSHGCVWRKGRFAAVFCLLGAQAKAMRAAVQGRSLLRQEQVVVGACRPAAGQPPVKAIFRWAPACMHQRRGRFGTPRTHTQTQADGVLGAAKVQAAVGATRRDAVATGCQCRLEIGVASPLFPWPQATAPLPTLITTHARRPPSFPILFHQAAARTCATRIRRGKGGRFGAENPVAGDRTVVVRHGKV
jgi:hypothetical protein